ncbi:VOC family protein [uncultured Sphaerochaeta sp.]|uniref:VOC family protein n=1 Tax=uncultured Sphaerochaeta sp. TaxID=886478 RepID=UPI002A0A8F02|nr:VOC family protein [uncultured Sphaerochaeta sp.]
MKYQAALIVVEDIEKSRQLYEKVLDQKVKSDYGENVTFLGDFSIHQKAHFQNLIQDRPIIQRSNSSELYFEHDDLPSIVSKIQNLGLELLHGIVEQPWKQQVVRFYDYDKNLIEIGESLEHVASRLAKQEYSIEEICKITYLDQQTVKQAIQKYS